MVLANFEDLRQVLADLRIEAVDGVLADLGVCSDQLDDASRGFRFSEDGPLDMRLDPERGEPARALLRKLSERDLADLFWEFGEERCQPAHRPQDRRGATAGAADDDDGTVADLVRRCVPRPPPPDGRQPAIDPATRVFQALRIAVNDELGALDRLLQDLPRCVRPGGRAVLISFHSLEDRRVKQAFRQPELWQVLTKKPVTAGDETKCERNPQSPQRQTAGGPATKVRSQSSDPDPWTPDPERGARMAMTQDPIPMAGPGSLSVPGRHCHDVQVAGQHCLCPGPEKKEVDDREKKDVDTPASVAAPDSKPATISPNVDPAFAAPMPLGHPRRPCRDPFPHPSAIAEAPAAVVSDVSNIRIPTPLTMSSTRQDPPRSALEHANQCAAAGCENAGCESVCVRGVLPAQPRDWRHSGRATRPPPVPAPAGSVAAPALTAPRSEPRTEGEPPLAPHPGPVQSYHVKHDGETPGVSRAGPSGPPIAATTSSSSIRTSRQTPI